MFGGIAFMLRGNMFCGVVKNDLMVRVVGEEYEWASDRTRARSRPMDFAGRPIRGIVYIGPQGYHLGNGLESWLERGLKLVASLPAK